jgi:hypothetical protein
MVHTYSTDSSERRYIPFLIAAAAIGAAFLTFSVITKYHISLPWWASPPIDTMAFYGLFYGLFDRYVWRWHWVRGLRITKIPDLSGSWHGYVNPAEANGVSSGLVAKVEIEVSIQQTWSTLFIIGRTSSSRSHSLSGSFVTSHECTLSYEYLNEPSAQALSTMHAHRGMARLSLDGTYQILEGEYYSGRDRQNIGTIRLIRTTS